MNTFIIAEVGVNHNGSVQDAVTMIDLAVEAGVDAVKFQTFNAEKLVIKTASKAQYQIENTGDDESQYEMLKKLELSHDDYAMLQKRCNDKGVHFISTPFDEESLRLLCSLGVEIIKIPSGEITNYPLLCSIGASGKKIIISTGMANLDEIKEALAILKNAGMQYSDITVLHCVTAYPAPFSDLNLNAIRTLQRELDVAVGYSDHSLGIEASVAAVALGAQVIEKHFTLDKTGEGPDHKASLEPSELKMLVSAVRNVERALGDGNKIVVDAEKVNMAIARKSIVSKCQIEKGDVFSENNLTVKRPGLGISPMLWNDLIGMEATRGYAEDELIEEKL